MKHGLFWRTFVAILAILFVTMSIYTAMLVNTQRENMQKNYETEVTMQARQVSELLQQMNQLSLIRTNRTIEKLVNQKILDIYNKYDADIWIVNFYSGRVEYIDRSWNTSEKITDESVTNELRKIQEGQEIRTLDLFTDELGEAIVTIGVPWKFESNGSSTVVGAVLLHIPREKLQISFISVLPTTAIPLLISLCLAVIFSTLVARSQIKPIRAIERSVRSYATGDFSSRIDLECGGELEDLAQTINSMAEDLNNIEASRKDFVANVSHELRSPMTSMKGYIQAIVDGVITGDDVPKYMHVVLDETNRLTDLVHDLLDLSRLESGRFPMEIAPFNVNELMCRVLVRYEQRISEKNINVNIELADDPVYANGDINRITQVISNLIDNAVKFMDGNSNVLTLRTWREGNLVWLSVIDNGPGISAEDLPRIQERFYKVDKAHTTGMGTGLGLSICKTILSQHGTRMEITSIPNQKTEFAFSLTGAETVSRKYSIQSS